MTILQSILTLGSIGIIAGLLLVISYSKLKVKEDPRVEKLLDILPGVNCGACGYASCLEYALSISKGDTEVDNCRAGGAELTMGIAGIMGVEYAAGSVVSKAAVRCNVKDRKYLAEYKGTGTCVSAQLLGGGMACKYGCFGYGDCIDVCLFDAIHLNEELIPVIDMDKCTGCGLCVKACSRDIIILKEVDDGRIVYVGCSNRQAGKDTKKVCDVGCIACNICEKKAPEGSFAVEDNLSCAVKQSQQIIIADIKCPTSCIYESKK